MTSIYTFITFYIELECNGEGEFWYGTTKNGGTTRG